MTTETNEEKPTIELGDGHAHDIVSACRTAARFAGWSDKRINELVDEMRAGDYDHLLQTTLKYFNVH